MELLTRERFSLNQVAKKLNVHVATIWRWTTKGVAGRKLPSIQIGGRRFVYADELEQWLEDGHDSDDNARVSSSGNVGGPRGRAGRKAEKAGQELERLGA